MKINKERKMEVINIIVIFLLIYFTCSKYALSLKGSMNLIALIVVTVCTIINNRKSAFRKFNMNSFTVFFFMLFAIISLLLIMQDNLHWYLIVVCYLLVSYVVYAFIDFIDYVEMFVKVMLFLSIFSLVIYIIYVLNIWNFSIFPQFGDSRNMFFSIVSVNKASMNAYRNYGLFWEPGAYQTFLSLALIFELFIKEYTSMKKAGIFSLTIMTTLSVAAYMTLFFILVAFIFNKRKVTLNQSGNDKKLKYILLFISLGLISWYFLPSDYKIQIIGKLKIFKNIGDESNISGSVRINSFLVPFKYYSKIIILGLGLDRFVEISLNENFGMLTFTPINWFAAFGLFWGLICNFSYAFLVKACRGNFSSKIFIIIALFSGISAENYYVNPLILIFIFYGIDLATNYANSNKDN